MLSLTGYAADASAEEESWVLLGPAEEAPLLLRSTEHATAQPTVPPKTPLAPLQPTRAPTAAAAGSVDDATLGAMSPAEQAALMVRLSALMSGPPSPSDAVPPRT